MTEQWKIITEATNYAVSNLGNIKNTKTGRLLNPGISGNGYKQVSLRMISSNKFEKRYVHRLVAQYWLENPENKREVNHKNLDRTDNRIENLEWVTSSDNQKHKYENGYYKTSNRIIIQLNPNTLEEIAKFQSVISAVKAMNGKSRSGIDKVLRGQQHTAYGFVWKFAD